MVSAEGKEGFVGALQGFKRASLEMTRLAIFAFRVRDYAERWNNASVHWMLKGGDDDKGKSAAGRSVVSFGDEEKGKGKEVSESKKREEEKEKGKEIDWWNYDPPK